MVEPSRQIRIRDEMDLRFLVHRLLNTQKPIAINFWTSSTVWIILETVEDHV